MHVSKWMRKNSKKIMVFVVIFSMVSFVIGYTGLQIFFSLIGADNPVIGTLEDGRKIRAREFSAAQNELRLLRMLGGDMVLMSQGQQGLAGPLMAYLLFPDSQAVAEAQLPTGLKQAAQRGQIPVSLELIEDFFDERVQSELVWMLLKTEAQNAGSVISDDQARRILQQIIPQLAQGADPARYINAIISQTNLTENQIVRVFADLMGVMFYTGNIINNQDVTLKQIQASIGRSEEKFNAEFVKIPAEWFIDPNSPVESDEMEAQFEAYKNDLPGAYRQENPFGFGYKLPKRVQLEYMTVLLDEVKTQIERPTAEQLEEFYTRNIEQFRYEEPADPNDPEGEQITRTRTFAESLPRIRTMLEQERVNRLANQIFNDAKAMTEQGFATVNVEQADLEQLRSAAGDYARTAQELSQRYHIRVVSGQTGLLSAADFGRDSILQSLRFQHGRQSLPLSELVYNVRLDPTQAHRQIGVPLVRPWENIGPMTGMTYDPQEAKTHRLMTMVRVTDVKSATVPDSMDVRYDVTGMIVLDAQREEKTTTFVLAEHIAADIRLAKAMEKAEAAARELAALAEEHEWDEALAVFNEQLKAAYETADLTLQTVRDQSRMSQDDKERMRLYMAANPASAEFIKDRLTTNALNEMLYQLLENGQETTGDITKALTVEQTRASYAVKRVTRIAATEADYVDNKAITALQLNTASSAEPALIHLNIRNLLNRLGYTSTQEGVIVDEPAPMLPVDGGF